MCLFIFMLQTVSYSQAIRWMEVAQWVARLIRYRSVLGPNPYNGSLKLCWKLLNNVNQRIDWSSWFYFFYNFTTYMSYLYPTITHTPASLQPVPKRVIRPHLCPIFTRKLWPIHYESCRHRWQQSLHVGTRLMSTRLHTWLDTRKTRFSN